MPQISIPKACFNIDNLNSKQQEIRDTLKQLLTHDTNCDHKDEDILDYFSKIKIKKDKIKLVTFNSDDEHTMKILRLLYESNVCYDKVREFCKNKISDVFKYKLKKLSKKILKHIKNTKNLVQKKFKGISYSLNKPQDTPQINKLWVTCSKGADCCLFMKTIIDMETHSTAYYLRLLVNSIIYNPTISNPNEPNEPINPLILSLTSVKIKSLNGVWMADWNHIIIEEIKTIENVKNSTTTNASASANNLVNSTTLNLFNPRTKQNSKDYISVDDDGNMPFSVNTKSTRIIEFTTFKPRLIMGFGPSAAGKTYLTNEIIKIFKATQPDTFPTTFISIDGGLIRESSYVYQAIIDNIAEYNNGTNGQKFDGFKNLMNNKNNELFPSTYIKEEFTKYLKKHYEGKISLYVPTTLSITVHKLLPTVENFVQPYIDITGDEKSWIGLHIWQHKTTDECNMKNKYKCKGTEATGEAREVIEGKKFSSKAWALSQAYAKELLLKAPGYKLKIHNSGGSTYINYNTVFNPKSSPNNSSIYGFSKNSIENNTQHVSRVRRFPSKIVNHSVNNISIIKDYTDYKPNTANANLQDDFIKALKSTELFEYCHKTNDANDANNNKSCKVFYNTK
uniref:Uncharacterized protein n=1 Tax=viral metagenome TaxID=1070528 RepID=A0A6C0HNB4_9ZZZZ